MDIDADQLLMNVIRDSLREAVKAKMIGYNSPLEKLITEAVTKHHAEFRRLLEDSIGSCIGNEAFREEIRSATRHSLSKILVQRFGGELEKQVNVLKSDPTTRARIVLAIEEIVKEKSIA